MLGLASKFNITTVLRYKSLCILCFIWILLLNLNIDPAQKIGDWSKASYLIDTFSNVQQNRFYTIFERYLPSPQLEFFLGIVLGSDTIKFFSRFNDVTLSAGMMHAIVASGYNINLVFTFLFKILGTKYNLYFLIIAQVVALIYAFLTGFNVPIIRAILMVSVIHWTTYLGYRSSGLALILKVALLMLVLSPKLYKNLSFLYTVFATTGLVLASKLPKAPSVLFELFQVSLMAQLLILPVGFVKFGTLNIVGLLSTVLLSFVVSLITVSGFISVLISYLCPKIVKFILIPINLLLTLFAYTCEIIGRYNTISVSISIYILCILIIVLIVSPILKFRKQQIYDK
ncbi:ComEC/Rec2 family competence protein [candidate division WWE3 bacterium]|nr:ComEC/Rec2 family competence protein [candidate division WWE3 bacterium]